MRIKPANESGQEALWDGDLYLGYFYREDGKQYFSMVFNRILTDDHLKYVDNHLKHGGQA